MPHSEFCENVENEIFVVLKRRNATFDHSCYLSKQLYTFVKGCVRKIFFWFRAIGHQTKQIQLFCLHSAPRQLIVADCVKIEAFFQPLEDTVRCNLRNQNGYLKNK